MNLHYTSPPPPIPIDPEWMAFSHPIRSNPNKSNTNPLDEHFTCTSRTSSFEESQTHSMICIVSHSAYPVPPFPFMVVFRLQRRRGLVWHVIKKFRTKVHVQCTVDHVDGGQKKRGHSQGGCRHPGSRRPRPTFPVQARPRLCAWPQFHPDRTQCWFYLTRLRTW